MEGKSPRHSPVTPVEAVLWEPGGSPWACEGSSVSPANSSALLPLELPPSSQLFQQVPWRSSGAPPPWARPMFQSSRVWTDPLCSRAALFTLGFFWWLWVFSVVSCECHRSLAILWDFWGVTLDVSPWRTAVAHLLVPLHFHPNVLLCKVTSEHSARWKLRKEQPFHFANLEPLEGECPKHQGLVDSLPSYISPVVQILNRSKLALRLNWHSLYLSNIWLSRLLLS